MLGLIVPTRKTWRRIRHIFLLFNRKFIALYPSVFSCLFVFIQQEKVRRRFRRRYKGVQEVNSGWGVGGGVQEVQEDH